MNLQQFTSLGASLKEKGEAIPANDERHLTLLIDGAASKVLEVDREGYLEFRSKVERLSRLMRDGITDEEKPIFIREVVHEFEIYRGASQAAIREQQSGWRTLGAMLLGELLANLGISAAAPSAGPLVQKLAQLNTASDIAAYRVALEQFLHPGGEGTTVAKAAHLRVADRSTENTNAAGLRGGGSAIEHLARVMADGRKGFVVLFRLSCLEMISERFGTDAVEDCLMAVSAYLTHSLNSDDAIFHWTDSSLLAILLDRLSQQIAAAELQKIASQNREITINVGSRAVMLRVPLTFELIPIDQLKSAEDISRLSGSRIAQR
jgi:GGDEF domain-containing protein